MNKFMQVYMKNLSYCFYFVLVSTIFLSCNYYSSETNKIFQQVESLVEQFPDSALLLLDSIRDPYELIESQRAQYILLSVQAKDKAYKDIENDTLIFWARDYFNPHCNPSL